MAKYYGELGFAVSATTEGDDVWTDTIEERSYYGDITRNYRRHVERDEIIDDMALNMQLSILADSFAFDNFQSIKYITYKGARWKVTTAEVAFPRLVLEIGAVYNG